MSSTRVSVGTGSNFVPGSMPNGFAYDVTVINTGTATAYLDTNQQSDTTTGQPLSAGSSVIWTKGQQLWAVAPAATTLAVTTNSGNLFDAGAIASQILSQGLATSIATAINVQGVPTIDVPYTPYNTSFATATGVIPTASSMFNVAAYSSINIYITESGATSLLSTRGILINWYEDLAGTLLAGNDIMHIACQSGIITGYVPRRAAYMKIVYQAATTTSATTITARVTASYNTVAAPRLLNRNGIANTLTLGTYGPALSAMDGTDGFVMLTGSCPASTTQSAYPALWPGLAEVDWYSGATSTALILLTCDSVYRVANFNNANAPFTRTVVIPNYPMEVRFTNSVASAQSYAISIRYLQAFVT